MYQENHEGLIRTQIIYDLLIIKEKEQTIMCEANAYLKDGENEVLFIEAVDTIEPYENGLKLMDIFGKQMFIQAKIKDMTLLNHRILLEKTDI